MSLRDRPNSRSTILSELSTKKAVVDAVRQLQLFFNQKRALPVFDVYSASSGAIVSPALLS